MRRSLANLGCIHLLPGPPGGLSASAEHAVGGGQEQRDRDLLGDPTPLPEDVVAGQIPAYQAHDQRRVEKGVARPPVVVVFYTLVLGKPPGWW